MATITLSAPRLLPWSSWSEWSQVYVALEQYLVAPGAPYPQELRYFHDTAVLRGRAPFAATTTLHLLQLLQETALPRLCDAALGLALIRLVNGVADSGQTGAFATSVAELARRVGLPRWLVDLRHDLTHGQQPEGKVLRLASGHAVQWLMGHYWRPQALTLATLGGGREEAPAIASLLDAYMAAGVGSAGVKAGVVEVVAAKESGGGGGKGWAGKRPRTSATQQSSTQPQRQQQQQQQPQKQPPKTRGGGPRLVQFSSAFLRTVGDALGDEPGRLLTYGCVVVEGSGSSEGGSGRASSPREKSPRALPRVVTDLICGQERFTGGSDFSPLTSDVTARCAPLISALTQGAKPSWHRHSWLSTVLMEPLIHSPGHLLNPNPGCGVSGGGGGGGGGGESGEVSAAFLPKRHAHAYKSFALWSPLLYSLERAIPGALRLLLRCLAVERARLTTTAAAGTSSSSSSSSHGVRGAGAQRTAMLDAWVWLLHTRYWASLFDWSLSVVPLVKKGGSGTSKAKSGGGQASSSSSNNNILLHARNAWTHVQSAWAYSQAPASSLLGLYLVPRPREISSSGTSMPSTSPHHLAVALSLTSATYHFTLPLLGGGGGGESKRTTLLSLLPPPTTHGASAMGPPSSLSWDEFEALPWYRGALSAPVLSAVAAATPLDARGGRGGGERSGKLGGGGEKGSSSGSGSGSGSGSDSSNGDPDLAAIERMLLGEVAPTLSAAAPTAVAAAPPEKVASIYLPRAPRWFM